MAGKRDKTINSKFSLKIMTKHILKIRQVDRIVFGAIKNSQKTIETRAATGKYREIKAGDILVFVCGDEKLEKLVERVDIYKSIDEMIKTIDFKSIMPFVNSITEMKKVYFSFPNYKEKIKKFGIVAFKLK
jgi:ASC-1-like (ASCH) protein